jgi:hypothetical protein
MLMLNQSRFHTNFTKLIPIKADYKNQTKQFPMSVQATEYNLALDQGLYLLFQLILFINSVLFL